MIESKTKKFLLNAIKALRQADDKNQIKGSLFQDRKNLNDDRYCALGCILKFDPDKPTNVISEIQAYDYLNSFGTDLIRAIWRMNDQEVKSFKEIADVLEQAIKQDSMDNILQYTHIEKCYTWH